MRAIHTRSQPTTSEHAKRDEYIETLCKMCRFTLHESGDVSSIDINRCHIRRHNAICKTCNELADELTQEIKAINNTGAVMSELVKMYDEMKTRADLSLEYRNGRLDSLDICIQVVEGTFNKQGGES